MLTYHYNEEKEYTHNEEAFLDPLETEIQEKEIYLLPANATFEQPPEAKEGFKIKWNGATWEYEEIPKEPEPPEPTLDELKVETLREVDTWTAQKITGGFVSKCTGAPVRYDSDKDTQLTMQGIALNVDTALFAEKYPNGCPVRGYAEGANTKSVFMLTPEQVMRWQADLSIHIGDCKVAGWQKQAEVQVAQSKEDLEAIILN